MRVERVAGVRRNVHYLSCGARKAPSPVASRRPLPQGRGVPRRLRHILPLPLGERLDGAARRVRGPFGHAESSDGQMTSACKDERHGAMSAPHNFIFYMKRSSPHASGILGLWRRLGLGFVGMTPLPVTSAVPLRVSPVRRGTPGSSSGHLSALGLPCSDPQGTRTDTSWQVGWRTGKPVPTFPANLPPNVRCACVHISGFVRGSMLAAGGAGISFVSRVSASLRPSSIADALWRVARPMVPGFRQGSEGEG